MTKHIHSNKGTSTIAKTDDGTIQIIFTIPFNEIDSERQHALKEMSANVQVPGFRKGNAPLDKVMEQVNQNALLEKTLSHILPELLGKAIDQHKIRPIIFPKYELVKAVEGEDWQIKAVTCEAPLVTLGSYKDNLKNAAKGKIWTPKSGEKTLPESTKEEKEQQVLKLLLEGVDIKIPNVLVQEEVDTRLSNLLSRIEKLGLSLDSYLASTGKTAEALRKEYEQQAKEGLSLDFMLSQIAFEEKLTVEPKEVEMAIKAAVPEADAAKDYDTPERRNFIEVILKRRKALDYILSLN